MEWWRPTGAAEQLSYTGRESQTANRTTEKVLFVAMANLCAARQRTSRSPAARPHGRVAGFLSMFAAKQTRSISAAGDSLTLVGSRGPRRILHGQPLVRGDEEIRLGN